jgi:hypothetical protein
MEYPKLFYPMKFNVIELLPLFDIHYGSKECNEKLFRQSLEYIKSRNNCFTFIGGDVIESAIYGSVGSVHAQKHQIQEQVEHIVEMLKPIRNRILFAICGNHEYRIEKATGLNIIQLMCNMLNIPYAGWEAYFVIKFKNNSCCKLYSHHGSGNSNTSGAKVNSLERLHFRAPMSNVIIAGHTHFATNMEKQIRYVDNGGNMHMFDQYYVSCGSTHTSDGYASMKGFAPMDTSMTKIKISSHKKDKFDVDVLKFKGV